MSKHQYKEIAKSLSSGIIELARALQVINDSLKMINEGKTYQIIPLSGQLRSLLAGKKKGNEPLLLKLAELLGEKLSLFVMPGVDSNEPPSKEGLEFHMSGFPISNFKTHQRQEEVDLIEFLNRKIIFFKGDTYSVHEIIVFFANKAGGSHYDPKIPLHFAEMLTLNSIMPPVLMNGLAQVGPGILEIGVSFMRKITNFELHILLCIPDQKITKEAFILDNKHPELLMRIFLVLNLQKKLVFGVTGMDGIPFTAMIDRIIDLQKPFHFTAIFKIQNDLSTKIDLLINGECLASSEVSFPIIVIQDFVHYDSYHNKSFDSHGQNLRFGMSQLCLYGRELQLIERAKISMYFEELLSNPEEKFTIYSKNSYAHSEVNSRDLKMYGNVTSNTLSALLANCDADEHAVKQKN